MMDSALNKIAEKILSLDEASLSSLWGKYKKKMELCDLSRDWEKAVIIFFIINSVRVKNQLFNEQMIKLKKSEDVFSKSPKTKPNLKLIK
jgi:hypothetical protein